MPQKIHPWNTNNGPTVGRISSLAELGLRPIQAEPVQGQVFQGERMTAALLDRLTHRCHIFEMNGESYRFRESVKAGKKSKPAGPKSASSEEPTEDKVN